MSVYKNSQYLAKQLARRHDPIASHAGAAHIIASGKLDTQCEQVLAALKRFPLHTARELARDARLDYIMLSKRLSVLEKRGLARRRGERHCTVSKTGIPATQWEAVG